MNLEGPLDLVSLDGRVARGKLADEVCPTCDGAGVEELQLDEARHYLRGAL